MNIGAKKKVMFLITKSNWGGAQRYVYDIATSLDTQKFSVVVVLGGDGTLAEMLKHAGIKTISISSLQRDVSIKKELAFINDLTKILKEEKPDVLHVNSSKAGLVGTFVGRITRVPRIIFTAHGWAFNEDRSYSQKIVLKVFHWLTVLLSHKTIAVSNAIVSQLQWLGIKNKFIVINPGRTIGVTYNKQEAREKIISLYPDLSRHENHTWIMTIAELHPIKRFNILTSPNFVFGLILFNSKSSLAEFSKVFLFFLPHSYNCLIVLSPTDLLGTLIILSKAKSSFF